MILIISFAPYIANNILKNAKTLYAINALALLIPLISLGGLIKGYYAGIGKIEITAYSQISEEIARIAFIILFGGYFIKGGEMYGAYAAILSLCMGEVFSLTHMIVSLKNLKTKTKKLFSGIINEQNLETKDILNMSLPLTGGKLIGSIAYMFEPIIITNVLLSTGMSNDTITLEYGILSGYAMPLLLMPGFFANAFGRVLLQPMTSAITKKNKKEAKKLFLSLSTISLIIGAFFSLVMFIFPEQLMSLLYRNSDGSNYVRIFAIPFILYYLESPFISAMTALGKTKEIMFYDVLTSAIRIGLLFILLPSMKMMGVAFSTSISFITLVIIFGIIIFKELKIDKQKDAEASN
jgi:stage V sporulation protein B